MQTTASTLVKLLRFDTVKTLTLGRGVTFLWGASVVTIKTRSKDGRRIPLPRRRRFPAFYIKQDCFRLSYYVKCVMADDVSITLSLFLITLSILTICISAIMLATYRSVVWSNAALTTKTFQVLVSMNIFPQRNMKTFTQMHPFVLICFHITKQRVGILKKSDPRHVPVGVMWWK